MSVKIDSHKLGVVWDAIRENYGCSQTDWARARGIDPNTVRTVIIRGVCHWATLQRIAKGFEVPAETFLLGDMDKQQKEKKPDWYDIAGETKPPVPIEKCRTCRYRMEHAAYGDPHCNYMDIAGHVKEKGSVKVKGKTTTCTAYEKGKPPVIRMERMVYGDMEE